jgi:benzoyl-CoA-dihydrodiol lyase
MAATDAFWRAARGAMTEPSGAPDDGEMTNIIDFQTDPSRYRHWRVFYEGDIASLFMDVDENGGLFEGCPLKLNSYDLSVDIELADIVQRMRFEHPEIRVVILRSGKDRVFCAGANIRMLAAASHGHKVNFCKFTNETRNAFEAAGAESGQKYICAIKGSCAGGGYELALACDYIMLADDGSSAVSLPEAPLLAVLPGTGGLTRVTDKRKLRRDLADLFCSTEEGVKGRRAKDWRLIDELVANSQFETTIARRAREFADLSARKVEGPGVALTPLRRRFGEDGSIAYSLVDVAIDRATRRARITVAGPDGDPPTKMSELVAQGAETYFLRLARELDDAFLHLRLNEDQLGVWIFRSQGDPTKAIAHERFLLAHRDHWLANEILLLWKRTMKRLDVTSRSLCTLIEHGSCFAGALAELAFAADRSFMMNGAFEGDNRPPAAITLEESNFGAYPMANGLTRLQSRFFGTPEKIDALAARKGQPLSAEEAETLGLVTFAPDDVDWQDAVRLFLEERASYSPDAMTGLEANLRFVGPETMETRIFGRLTAWQNWIFQRPNAVGKEGALQRYGTGLRGAFDMRRV